MKRIKALAAFCSDNYRSYADIGSDHGYFALELRKLGITAPIYCTDNKPQPLKAAQKTLANIPNITYLLGNGLEVFNESIDLVCIAGMGGCLIGEIIVNSLTISQKAKELILAPNNDFYKLRCMLNDYNFTIIDEINISEKNKYYPILKVRYNSIKQTLSETEKHFGPFLLKKADKTFLTYWENKLKALCKNPDASINNQDLAAKIIMIEKMLKNEIVF